MKIFKRIFIWSLISLAIQLGGLYYIENYILSTQTSVKIKKVEKNIANKVPDAKIIVPDGAEGISASFDAKYLAYYEDDSLKVVNTRDGNVETVDFDEGVEISFYKWLPDRDRILIAEKHIKDEDIDEKGFKLSYYDVAKSAKEEIKDITWAGNSSEVSDIQVSTLTNIICVKVSHNELNSKIYWINIMKEMRKIKTKSSNIGNMRVLPHEDRLIYEDLNSNNVYATNIGKISIEGIDNTCLIGVDNSDRVYVGQVVDNNIVKIFYGKLNEDTIKWNNIALQEPVNKEKIYVLEDGHIYVNDNLKGIIKEISNGKQTAYKGTFLQLYNKGVVSISEGKLVKTPFN